MKFNKETYLEALGELRVMRPGRESAGGTCLMNWQ